MFLDDKEKEDSPGNISMNYIDTAEPIGSRNIARKHELGD
jgi:hypothetical protein